MKRNILTSQKTGLATAIFYFLIVAVISYSFGQQPKSSGQPLAILPFNAVGMEPETVQTIEVLLRQELTQLPQYSLISESKTYDAVGETVCTELECAVEIGNTLGVKLVVLGTLSQLGKKIIFHYILIDVGSGKTLLSDNVSSRSVEDMDVVMKRVARSIVTRQPIDQTAQVGTITAAETRTPRRRSARKYWGINFGYLYPTNGYDDDNRSFTLDMRLGFEIEQFAVGTHFAARKGFAANVYGSYLLTKTDICPYFGGAFGFHWINHEEYFDNYPYTEKKKDSDGFEITANTGLRLFRTYNFQVLLNFDYILTFNDYDDQAVVFTIGLLR